jgi:hypothetical protein
MRFTHARTAGAAGLLTAATAAGAMVVKLRHGLQGQNVMSGQFSKGSTPEPDRGTSSPSAHGCCRRWALAPGAAAGAEEASVAGAKSNRRILLRTGTVAPVLTTVLLAVAPAAGAAPADSPAAATTVTVAAGSGGTWRKAEEVPGTAALNKAGGAGVSAVSCASAGNCSAGGFYLDSPDHDQVFVVSQAGGTWGKAEQVPGIAALNTYGDAQIESVSCASAGNCSAGGYYTNGARRSQAFVVSQVDGTWGTAEQVPGTTTRKTVGFAAVSSLSCASAGNCSAVGEYTHGSDVKFEKTFVVSQAGGTWGKAEQVPGLAALNTYGGAGVDSVSCASAGTCSAGGSYTDSSGHSQAFVVSQAGGIWGKAEQVPGLAALNKRGYAGVGSVSCASAGNCSAGGYYHLLLNGTHSQAFVVSQAGGTWGKAEQVPGIATLNKGGNAQVNSVSCGSAGTCSAGGYYQDSSGVTQAFVVSQTGGTWGNAEQVPGTATLNKGAGAGVGSVSCAPAGTCSAVGEYTASTGHSRQVFVVSQAGGTWGKAEQIPGTATLNKGGDAQVNSVSCAPAGTCSAGGSYTDSSGHSQAFVVSKT